MNFEAARENMVDCQISPLGVVDRGVLDSFLTVPREKFAAPGQEGIAYCDEDLPLGGGRYLMEPSVHARLLQHAAPKPEDIVLEIGSGAGYSTAILSSLVSTVFALESDQGLLSRAESIWQDLEYTNIVSVQGSLRAGCPDHAPYSLIFFNGAISNVPEEILGQLDIGGRMIAVLSSKPGQDAGKAMLIECTGPGQFSDRTLFDANIPCLPDFEPRKEFVF